MPVLTWRCRRRSPRSRDRCTFTNDAMAIASSRTDVRQIRRASASPPAAASTSAFVVLKRPPVRDTIVQSPIASSRLPGIRQISEGPSGSTRDVAEMARAADLAAQQLAVGENRPTDAGAQREQDDVLRAAGGAEPRLAKQSSLRIVDDRHVADGAKEFLPVETLETGESLGHDSNRSAIRCRKSWCSNAHPLQCIRRRPQRANETPARRVFATLRPPWVRQREQSPGPSVSRPASWP